MQNIVKQINMNLPYKSETWAFDSFPAQWLQKSERFQNANWTRKGTPSAVIQGTCGGDSLMKLLPNPGSLNLVDAQNFLSEQGQI